VDNGAIRKSSAQSQRDKEKQEGHKVSFHDILGN